MREIWKCCPKGCLVCTRTLNWSSDGYELHRTFAPLTSTRHMLPEHYISQILAPMDFFMGANVWRAKMPGSLCPKIKPFSVVSGMAKPEGMMVKMNRHKRRRSFLFVLNQQQQQSDSREGSQLVLRKHVGHFSGTKASPSQATLQYFLPSKSNLTFSVKLFFWMKHK